MAEDKCGCSESLEDCTEDRDDETEEADKDALDLSTAVFLFTYGEQGRTDVPGD